MITQIEALNYRCLRDISRPLEPFQVLVGPNASGKTTFLDVIAFLGDLAANGLDGALESRSVDPRDLLTGHRGDAFEMAVEAKIPTLLQKELRDPTLDLIRYEIRIGEDAEKSGRFCIVSEKAVLKKSKLAKRIDRPFFPMLDAPRETLLLPKTGKTGYQVVLNKSSSGNDNFYSEVYREAGKGWVPSFRLGPYKSALGNMPDDISKFPVATWFREFLTTGVQKFVLNSLHLRRASPPTKIKGFSTDGSNLPWVVKGLREQDESRFQRWIEHLQTALPDLETVRTVEREDDRHCYLMFKYRGGLEVPSWMVSDGTLRLLALTLPAYLPSFTGVYLIEEPENGIHPRAVAAVLESLSSVYQSQVLLASHSPVVLGMVDPQKILCFAKSPEGFTDVISGSEHPALRNWKGECNIGVLFAGGVLG